MSGLVQAVFGGGEKTSNTTFSAAPPTEEERQLIALNTELARKQLENINSLAPFQQELLTQSLADLKRQGAISSAVDSAVTPEQQAALAKQDYERALKLGPIQDQLLQAQLDAMQGKISPEQEASINQAIEAGSGDIDVATKRGIGLISDELANSRGLRLTDTPILREATLLSRAGVDQKASLAKNLRAQGMLGMPQLSSGIAMGQQNLADATAAFQADLRQRAFQNRLALSGQTSTSGIGLASVGSGVGASTLGSLTSVRGKNTSGSEFDPAALIGAYGGLARGIGMAGAGMNR